MHEWGITQDLIDEVKKQAESNGIAKVITIRVALGKKSDMTGHVLRTCFMALTKDTSLADAKLQIKNTQDHKVIITAIKGERAVTSARGNK